MQHTTTCPARLGVLGNTIIADPPPKLLNQRAYSIHPARPEESRLDFRQSPGWKQGSPSIYIEISAVFTRAGKVMTPEQAGAFFDSGVGSRGLFHSVNGGC